MYTSSELLHVAELITVLLPNALFLITLQAPALELSYIANP
jgi:hypothetical protein